MEYNPLVGELGVVANFRALSETAKRPALIFGTSSDRIGTPHGQSYYATVSKSLRGGSIPIAPYAGISYSTYEDRVIFPWGVNVALGRSFSTMLINDGVHSHLSATYSWRNFSVTLLAVERKNPGFSIGASW